MIKTLILTSSLRAYSSAVERVHGMDEAGVRLPVGPPKQRAKRLTSMGEEILRRADRMYYNFVRVLKIPIRRGPQKQNPPKAGFAFCTNNST